MIFSADAGDGNYCIELTKHGDKPPTITLAIHIPENLGRVGSAALPVDKVQFLPKLQAELEAQGFTYDASQTRPDSQTNYVSVTYTHEDRDILNKLAAAFKKLEARPLMENAGRERILG